MSKLFLSGNEAIARGAYAAGCHVASAYPGTPSTEILENIAKFKGEINCEWSVNGRSRWRSASAPRSPAPARWCA